MPQSLCAFHLVIIYRLHPLANDHYISMINKANRKCWQMTPGMTMCRLVGPPLWASTTGRIAITFRTKIHSPQRMKSTDLSVPLTFLLAPTVSKSFHFSQSFPVKYFWRHGFSWFPEDDAYHFSITNHLRFSVTCLKNYWMDWHHTQY